MEGESRCRFCIYVEVGVRILLCICQHSLKNCKSCDQICFSGRMTLAQGDSNREEKRDKRQGASKVPGDTTEER